MKSEFGFTGLAAPPTTLDPREGSWAGRESRASAERPKPLKWCSPLQVTS